MQLLERSLAAAQCVMPQRARMLGQQPLRDELVVTEERTVEERDAGRSDRSRKRAVDAREDRCKEQALCPFRFGDLIGNDGTGGLAASVVTRRRSRHGDGADLEVVAGEVVVTAWDARPIERNLQPAVRWLHEARKGRLSRRNLAHDGARAQDEAMFAVLTERCETPEMIDVRIGKEHSGDRRTARFPRLERRERFDLRGDVGRAVEQQPAIPVTA